MDVTIKPIAGRPLKHLTEEQKRAANALAARQYRERKKAKRQAWRDPSTLPKSDIIDLSALPPPWRLTQR